MVDADNMTLPVEDRVENNEYKIRDLQADANRFDNDLFVAIQKIRDLGEIVAEREERIVELEARLAELEVEQ